MALLSTESESTAKQETLLEIATFDVQGMKCAGCVNAVERQLKQNVGVTSASVNLVTEVAVIKYTPNTIKPEIIAENLTAVGFPAQLRESELSHSNKIAETHKKRQQQRQEQLRQLVIAGILLFFSSLGHLHHLGGPEIPLLSHIAFHWSLATLAILLPGRNIFVDGWRALWHGMPNMNTLVGLGTGSAYGTSCLALLFPAWGWECFFDEPVMLLGFILLGRTLEARARSQASAALEKLTALQPDTARLIGSPELSNTSDIEIPVDQVRMGEWLKVLPGEKIPVDGTVVNGQTLVDEAMLTGESTPMTKQVGDEVKTGTINQSGVIVLAVDRIGSDTTLSKIIATVEEAQSRKAPIQQFADTVAGYFAYGVMAIALLTFLFWNFWGTELYPQVLTSMSMSMASEVMPNPSPVLLSLKLAIAVLVVACPCALGLATPTAILVGTSLGAEKGLLIKGGEVLSLIHRLDTIVFDKTGTLTMGKPSLTDCLPAPDFAADSLLQIAATVESGTNHPLAEAITQAADKQNLSRLDASDYVTEPGLGIAATVEGKAVLLGSPAWLAQHHIALSYSLEEAYQRFSLQAKTPVCMAIDGEIAGVFALQDTLRPQAKATISRLQNLGLKVAMLTGDRILPAQAIAKELDISHIFAEVYPAEKVSVIQMLQADKPKTGRENHPTVNAPGKPNQSRKIVAMVGDGINDAPALAQADIGITLRSATEVAKETAGIVLTHDRLEDVVTAIELSQKTYQKIRQNLSWALGYNLIAIPLAAGVLLPQFNILLSPAIAAALMALSSVSVVVNSLMLRYTTATDAVTSSSR